MELRNQPVSAFVEALASRRSVPGGGGACALAGSLAAGLGHMVGELTVGKAKYIDVEEDIIAMMERAEALCKELLECIDKDAEAFAPLAEAYGMPKDDPSRDLVMETCLKEASAVPLRITELAAAVIELEKGFAEKGSALAASDAATGAVMARAALYGGAVNVKINTKYMKDRAYAESINARVDELIETYSAIADDVYGQVYGRF